ncbi:hypothetical protein BUALT_Bualt16G0131200 [Buddleja alternifolia]|uniref:Uncharacterized protein n=1 Tax=Buddleja alternifolia TaxID=168488 RepID=A0AAV6WBY7_9LAMI|nr:hypothetical protein BUALT_Bualt16G0131200 [Buddleja alternifolia]
MPPRRAIDHKIELEPGARPPAMAPYRMNPAELVELRRQLDELLDAGLIDGKKVRAVAEWTAPSKVADLRSFLGSATTIEGSSKGTPKL